MSETTKRHPNLTAEEYADALRVIDVPCIDEDGRREVITVTVTFNDWDDGFDILVYRDREVIDGDTRETHEKAEDRAAEFVKELAT